MCLGNRSTRIFRHFFVSLFYDYFYFQMNAGLWLEKWKADKNWDSALSQNDYCYKLCANIPQISVLLCLLAVSIPSAINQNTLCSSSIFASLTFILWKENRWKKQWDAKKLEMGDKPSTSPCLKKDKCAIKHHLLLLHLSFVA